MLILGIETSCDETSAAIVEDGRSVYSNVVVSSLKEHQQYGGIIPEIASRRQLECITPVVDEALAKANVSFDDIDAIAVTQEPGLIGSLLVGISFAEGLAVSLNKPLIRVNHIHAHLYASALKDHDALDLEHPLPNLPAIGLVVSGGHSSLFRVTQNWQFELLGQTRDDAAGEAFDKVARILDLGYPGGPVIDRMAKNVDKTDLRFKCGQMDQPYDFSFSGIKTAVLYHHQKNSENDSYNKSEVVHAFQKSVVKDLVSKSLRACLDQNLQTLLIGGGVAANSHLRSELQSACDSENISLHIPAFRLCLDNAAMIAGLAFYRK